MVSQVIKHKASKQANYGLKRCQFMTCFRPYPVTVTNKGIKLTLPLVPKQSVNDLSNHLSYPFPCSRICPYLSSLLGSSWKYKIEHLFYWASNNTLTEDYHTQTHRKACQQINRQTKFQTFLTLPSIILQYHCLEKSLLHTITVPVNPVMTLNHLTRSQTTKGLISSIAKLYFIPSLLMCMCIAAT